MTTPPWFGFIKKFPLLGFILITHVLSVHLCVLLSLLKLHKPKIAPTFETCLWIDSQGFEKESCPMGKGGSQKLGDFEITMTHAMHSNSIDNHGVIQYGGEPAGYIIRMPGGFTLYHAGDTAVFGDMKLIGKLYKPDLAMLPIGDRFTMGPREAAYAIHLLGTKHIVPMHYATFPFLTGTAEALRKETGNIAKLEIHTLKPGEQL